MSGALKKRGAHGDGHFACVGLALMDHYRVVESGEVADAMATWLFATLWTKKNRKDGFIPSRMVERLVTSDPVGDAKVLVDAGLFAVVDGGYQVLRYELWNETVVEEDARKAAYEEKKAAERAKKAQQRGQLPLPNSNVPRDIPRDVPGDASSSFSSSSFSDQGSGSEIPRAREEQPAGHVVAPAESETRIATASAPPQDTALQPAQKRERPPDLTVAGMAAPAWAEGVFRVTGGRCQPSGPTLVLFAQTIAENADTLPDPFAPDFEAAWQDIGERFALWAKVARAKLNAFGFRDWVAEGKPKPEDGARGSPVRAVHAKQPLAPPRADGYRAAMDEDFASAAAFTTPGWLQGTA